MGSDLGGAMKSFKSAINEKEKEEVNSEDSIEGRIIEGETEQKHEASASVGDKEKI